MTTTACVLPAFLVGGLAVQIGGELGFAEAGVGLGLAVFFAAAALASAFFGRVTERLGPERGLRLAAVWSAAVQLGIAGLARGPLSLYALLAVAGTANALAQPAANLMIARRLPQHRQGLAFAVKQSAVPMATLLAGAAVPAVALTVGWRWAFAGGAALALSSTLFFADGGPMRVRARMRPASNRRIGHAPDDDAEQAARFDVPVRIMTVLAVGIGLGAAAAGTLGGFLVSSAVDLGFAEATAGLTLALGSATGIVVRLVAGVRADRRDGGHLRVVWMMLLGGALAFALMATGQPALFVAAVPLAFGAGWAWPGLFNLAVVRVNPSAPAAATGVTQTGTYIGGVVGPVCAGYLASRWSFEAAWLAAGCTALMAAGAIAYGRSLLISARRAPQAEPLPPLPT
jgi:MFS family permease